MAVPVSMVAALGALVLIWFAQEALNQRERRVHGRKMRWIGVVVASVAMLGATASFSGVAFAGGSTGSSTGAQWDNHGSHGATNRALLSRGEDHCFYTVQGSGRLPGAVNC